IYEGLTRAELFERFLHTKFIGQKRFSLEGAEPAIPMLDTIIEHCPQHGIREIVLGMSHRGRLNVLANVLKKPYEAIFSEFQDNPLIQTPFGSGDVKYHKGYSADRYTQNDERIHLTLTSNPSHLEAVDPVALGRAKAKQTFAGDSSGESILPVLLHGDAAFAGQGIVSETLNLSRLNGYSTGGTIHIIINNQIGFTTTPAEARSTLYCSDVAKMIQVPIFHVNGEDPEAAVHCLKLAVDYRQRFGDDVVIDLVCYRRHGHNEADEPAFTQPRLYEKIRNRPSMRKLYADRLTESSEFSSEEVETLDKAVQSELTQAYDSIAFRPPGPDEPYAPRGPWKGYQRERPTESVETAVSLETLSQIVSGLGTVPDSFHIHPKLRSLIEQRGRVLEDGHSIDWAMAEALAFGSLVLEGSPVRLSGQDSSRGTFSQRHALFVDQESGEEYVPLSDLSSDQARFEVFDSLLSEAGVLGFEYGYSLADPSTLTLWEAQFGDFANGAQVIIDQFVTSALTKWGRMSGLVMLLPHGYEGQGPEHSSARIERFLQICAEDCLQVVNCTTAAQYFHVLRRQILRPYRAPLVIFTPKSLLRSPLAASLRDDFTQGHFQPVIDDPLASGSAHAVERLILSFGKVHYDLVEERKQILTEAPERVSLVRIEEIYPWPEAELRGIHERYPNLNCVVWAQEEPRNMGGWSFVQERLRADLPPDVRLVYAGRAASSSTATGSSRAHHAEQRTLVADAYAGLGESGDDPWALLRAEN
ncbi:MAG: 2-oxoglutarate dehydrogenase E1 component, partial [Myxococcota bacterium]|nr:2-oxoglutarate dehydrogenase E1 component [Myxococcota bacterium]